MFSDCVLFGHVSLRNVDVKVLKGVRKLKKIARLGVHPYTRGGRQYHGPHPLLGHQLFDRIVFNFPHAGFTFRENDEFQIM